MRLRSVGLGAVAAAGFYLAVRRIRNSSRIDPRGKVVLITGGSRGLGLATAREFGSHGSILAICARNEDELHLATEDLRARGVQAHCFVCDITNPRSVEAMVAGINSLLGPIDILVNNAGIIKVGPVSDMETSDFEQAMNVMFGGMLHTSLAVIPAMRARRQGSIVNITSIGGKVTVPHLLPYCCAKFAAMALSEGLGIELAPLGIRVTTIVPGLMRTGSHLNAEFKGQQRAEYGWFAAGAATPAISISAERAARCIVKAAIRGERERILSLPAKVLANLNAITPSLCRAMLSTANRFLPQGQDEPGHSQPGRALEAEFTSAVWKTVTKPGENAAVSLNEAPHTSQEIL